MANSIRGNGEKVAKGAARKGIDDGMNAGVEEEAEHTVGADVDSSSS